MSADKKKIMGVSAPDEPWLKQISEEVLQPALPIVDAHHHLWIRPDHKYLLDEYVEDLDSGHNIVATVYAECHSMYRQSGPEQFQSLGETEFVTGCAAMADSGVYGNRKICRGMVGWVDLQMGEQVAELLDVHLQRSGGRFKGVRLTAAWDDHPRINSPASRAQLLSDPAVIAAVKVMAARQLALDCWVYHTQLDELAELAALLPRLRIVLNHTGVPVLGGPNRDRRDEVFKQWRRGMMRLAEYPNVFLKLGAVPIRKSGDGVDRSLPPTSEEIASAWAPWMLPCIEWFGPERCLFESNFPVQKLFSSYQVTWNAFKLLAKHASDDERRWLFHDAAINAYQLG